MLTPTQKEIALLGLPVTITFEPTAQELKDCPDHLEEKFSLRTEEIRVRPMTVKQFDRAMLLLEAGEEVEFTAHALGRPRAWLEQLTGESCAALAVAVQNVNQHGFFACFGLRTGRKAVVESLRARGAAELRGRLAGDEPSPSASRI